MTPAILVLLSVFAFHSAPAKDVSTQKTWMNDDIEWLRANAPISVIGSISAPLPVAPAPAGPYVPQLDPSWYKQQIDSLQKQIDDANSRLRGLQAAQVSGVGNSNVIPLNQSMTIDADQTIQNLQTQVKSLSGQIGSLQDLARQNSVPPGDIR
jgi:hypothetical protein